MYSCFEKNSTSHRHRPSQHAPWSYKSNAKNPRRDRRVRASVSQDVCAPDVCAPQNAPAFPKEITLVGAVAKVYP
ncbi:unnamed protein product [Ectocarpus sp. 8 AP-2014]